MKLVINIPCYNEEKTLPSLLKRMPQKIEGIKVIEILVMDDCSKDNTVKVAKEGGADYVIKNKHNQGLGVNFKKGIENALKLGADIIVNIDADGQFNPEDIPKLIDPILNLEADMVTCSRFLNNKKIKNMSAIKRFGNKRFTSLISKITGQKFTDTQCGFRAYSKEAALRMNINGKFTYTQEVFIDLVEKGMRIKEVSLEVKYFKERKSHISGKLRNYSFKSLGIIAKATRDTQPMTFFGLPALILFILGFLGAGFSFGYWLIYSVVTPVRQLFNVSVFLMIFGASLGILALLADMLKSIKRDQDEILYRLKKKEFRK
jgi:glycosyltransferase involved in cell wall biosynthesis